MDEHDLTEMVLEGMDECRGAAVYWIDQYVASDVKGFTGEFKSTPEDFVVTEIGPDGAQVATGELVSPPIPPFAERFEEARKADDRRQVAARRNMSAALQGGGVGGNPVVLRAEDGVRGLTELLGEEVVEKVRSLAEKPDGDNVVLGVVDDKERRRKLHRFTRLAFPSLTTCVADNGDGARESAICRDTAFEAICDAFGVQGAEDLIRYSLDEDAADEGRVLTLMYQDGCDKAAKKRFHEASRKCLPSLMCSVAEGKVVCSRRARGGKKRAREEGLEEPYTHFTLTKINTGWFEAVRILSNHIGCGERDIVCAGMKDKKAVTTQRCSVRGLRVDELLSFEHDRLKVSNLEVLTKPMQTGCLGGNSFEIRLRGCSGLDNVASCVDAVSTRGFVNFFGPQRFSCIARKDLHVGGCLVRGDWAGALDVLMAVSEADSPEVVVAKEAFLRTRDARAAARSLPPHRTAERTILMAVHHKAAPPKWFMAVGHSERELWVHAMQSWIWNKVVSLRLQRYGCDVLKGDLVVPRAEGLVKPNKGEPLVCRDASKYSISDVVLPKPGAAGTTYPDNAVAGIYDEVLREYGLTREWDGAKAVGVNLYPDYRRVVQRPERVSHRVEGEDVVVAFSLPPSCYAT
eukprot:Sspe_Gene.42508::Locus_20634_Transcript_1_1_Confidence_1.000_Length_1935::g.42508::m.42508/K06176/truD, PUS7; tRNA pseudouridine13 synthase